MNLVTKKVREISRIFRTITTTKGKQKVNENVYTCTTEEENVKVNDDFWIKIVRREKTHCLAKSD